METVQADVPFEEKPRNAQWLTFQPAFVHTHWAAKCSDLGLRKEHMEYLWFKFFRDLGNAYRSLNIDPEDFEAKLNEMCDGLLSHLDRYKYYLSMPNGDVGWVHAVEKFCSAECTPSTVDIDIHQRVAFCDVHFPNVHQEGDTRVRYVFRERQLPEEPAQSTGTAEAEYNRQQLHELFMRRLHSCLTA